MTKLTHTTDKGAAHMVDVGAKDVTERVAVAEGYIKLSPSVLEMIMAGDVPKGDTIAVARVAAIMAAKNTSNVIPLCHALPVSSVTVDFLPVDAERLKVTATVKVGGKTGVEMEALTAVSVGALTVYDMVKAVCPDAVISDIRLIEKTGGKSGHYRACPL